MVVGNVGDAPMTAMLVVRMLSCFLLCRPEYMAFAPVPVGLAFPETLPHAIYTEQERQKLGGSKDINAIVRSLSPSLLACIPFFSFSGFYTPPTYLCVLIFQLFTNFVGDIKKHSFRDLYFVFVSLPLSMQSVFISAF